MFVGGCAGSTSGGLKMGRVLMTIKHLAQRTERAFRPKRVRAMRINDELIDEDTQRDAYTYIIAYLLCFALSSLVLSALGLPFLSSVSAVASCMSNTGPGLQLVGPSHSYSALPDSSLLFLCFCMIVGRLEIFTVLALFVPSFWRFRSE